MLQLTRFNIITPKPDAEGRATTYWPDEFPDDEFFDSSKYAGAFELWAPTRGATTANSDKTRTEFREIVEGTHELMNWQIGEYDQFLRAGLILSQATPNGRVCVAQIHVKDNERPPIKLVWDNGKLRLKYRTSYDQASDVGVTVLDGLPLGERFSYSMHVTPAGTVSVTVRHAGREDKQVVSLDSTWHGKLLYFKAGLYNQEAASDSTLPTDGSRAVFDKLEIQR